LSIHGASWSPDGSQIALSSDARGVFDIGIYTLETGAITWLTAGSGDRTHPAWSPDGKRLVTVHSQEASTCLDVYDLGSPTPFTCQVEPGLHYFPRFTPSGEGLLCVFDNPGCPDDLWEISLRDGSRRRLTDSLPQELREAPFVMPDLIRYPGLDGVPVPALLYRPQPGDNPPPGVVLVHGGPNWRYDVMWYPLVQHMVSRGWVVIQPNYRGSTGYGREWQYASRYDQGGVDTRDVVAGAIYLAQNGLADPARIAVTGASHGGYLTMMALTRYPELWVAGSAVVPFLNWFTSHANSRDDLQHWDRENFGDPVKDHDLWYERSPFFFLDRVKAPVQLICGGNDPRCPPGESIAAREALEALGKPVDFSLYPDEGHGFLKTENVVDAALRRVAFLSKALDG
jgi:dipeptidyl aminopeptidase/acylaminoacyl peptidase